MRWFFAFLIAVFCLSSRGIDASSSNPPKPIIDSVSPNRGGLAGGTLITIRGKNLQPQMANSDDSVDDNPLVKKVEVLLGGSILGRGIVCDVVHYLSSSTKIVCETRAVVSNLDGSPFAKPPNTCQYRSDKVQVFVNGQGGFIRDKWNKGFCNSGVRYWRKLGQSDKLSCRFKQTFQTSTLIHEVFPRQVGPGDEVTITGESRIFRERPTTHLDIFCFCCKGFIQPENPLARISLSSSWPGEQHSMWYLSSGFSHAVHAFQLSGRLCFHDVYAFEEHGITDKTEQLDIMANADDELRNPGLRWIDEVSFGEYACNPRDAKGDFYAVHFPDGGNVNWHWSNGESNGCRYGSFKCRLPDDIPKGYYNVSISNGRAQMDTVYPMGGRSNGAGYIGNPNNNGRGHSMIAKDGDSGGFAFSAMNGSYSLAVVPVVHGVSVTGDRTLTVSGEFLSGDMYLSIGDTGYGAQPVKATCSVNTNQTVLDCELASSENRSLGQIANVSIDNGFLSARSGVIRERWAFETASDNWYTYPWQDNWDFRHDAKAVIASFRAVAKQATDVDIIAETWRTGPLFKGIPDDFARRNGVWYQSTFFAPPKTAMYRFPIKYQAHTNAEKPKTYVDGEFYSGVNVYKDAARGAFAWKPMVEGSVYHLEIHGLKHGKGNGQLEVGMDMTFNLEDAPQLNPGSQNTLSQLVTTGMGLDGGLTTWRVLLPDDVEGGAFSLKLGAADSISWKIISLADEETDMKQTLTSLFAWSECTENYDDGMESKFKWHGKILQNTIQYPKWKEKGKGYYNLPEVDNSFETEFSEWEVGHLKLVDGIAEWKGGIRDMTTAACGRSSLKVRGSRTTPGKGIGSTPVNHPIIYRKIRGIGWTYSAHSWDANYPGAFSTGRYLSFYYKIPPGTQANLVLTFNRPGMDDRWNSVENSWRSRCSIPMTWTAEREELWDIPKCGDSGHNFEADDTWREAVIDIKSMLESGGYPTKVEPKITYLEFASPMQPVLDKCKGKYGIGCDDRPNSIEPDVCGNQNPEEGLRFLTERTLDLIGDFNIDEIGFSKSPRQMVRVENNILKQFLSEGKDSVLNLRVKKSQVRSGIPRQIDIEVQFAGGCGLSKASNISKPVELVANFGDLAGNKSASMGILATSSSTALRDVEVRLIGPSTGGSNITATLPIAGSPTDWKKALDALHIGLNVEVRENTRHQESCQVSRVIEWGRTVTLQSDNTTVADDLAFGNAAVPGSQWDSGVSVAVINEGIIENDVISVRDGGMFLPSSMPSVSVRHPSGSVVRCSPHATADEMCDFDMASLTNLTRSQSKRRRRDLLGVGSSDSPDTPQSPRRHISSTRGGFTTSIGENSRKFHREMHGPPNILKEADLLGMKAVMPRLDSHSPWSGRTHDYGYLRKQVTHHKTLRRSLLSTSTETMSGNFSDPATWNGTSPNWTNVEILYIPSNTTLVLDESVYVRFWVIEGTLIVSDTKNITMEAEAVIVHGEDGKLLVGNESDPFTHNFDLLLHGSWQDLMLPKFGIKTLAMTDGEIVLHGKPVTPTWSLLNHTAKKGDSSIVVKDVTNWKAGDKIVIAAASRRSEGNCRINRDDQCQSEERFITSIVNHDGDGLCTVHLSEPLNHDHLGITHSSHGHSIEMRAEVINLSRNVRVRGTSDIPYFGSHIMTLSGKLILKYFETTYAGQAFQLGRYAVHIHTVGQPSQKKNGGSDQSGSFIYGNAIHHSFNRALTAHACHNLTVTRNVAYNVLGHQFFIEDGVETRNKYTENVGLMAHQSFSSLNVDQTPANFWITNPNNDFVGNRAAGSAAFGFWFDTFTHPSGPSSDSSVWSMHAPLGAFDNNTAHSCSMDGFWIDQVDPREKEIPTGMRVTGTLMRCEAWLNGALGIGLVTGTGHLHVIDAKVASNNKGGIGYIKNQADRWWSKSDTNAPVVLRPVIFGDGPYSGRSIGFGAPFSGYTSVVDAVFIGFGERAPIAACLPSACKPWKAGHESRWYNTTFLGQTGPKVMWRDTFADNFLYDADGTISGTYPKSSWIHNTANGTLGYFDPDACRLDTGTAGIVCDPAKVSLRVFNVFDHSGLDGRRGLGFIIKTKFGKAAVPFFHYNHAERRWNVQFTVMMTNKTNSLPIVHEINVDTDVFDDPELRSWSGSSHLRDALMDEWAVFRFPTLTLPDSISTKVSDIRTETSGASGFGYWTPSLVSQNSYNKTSVETFQMEPWGGFTSTDHVAGDWVYLPNQTDADNHGNGGYFDMLLSGASLPKVAGRRGGANPPSPPYRNMPYSLECESDRADISGIVATRGKGCFFKPDEGIKMLRIRSYGPVTPSRTKPDFADQCFRECDLHADCRGIVSDSAWSSRSRPWEDWKAWDGSREIHGRSYCHIILGELKGTFQELWSQQIEYPHGDKAPRDQFPYRRIFRRNSRGVKKNSAGDLMYGHDPSLPICDDRFCDKSPKMKYPFIRDDCDPKMPERNCFRAAMNCVGGDVNPPKFTLSESKTFSWCDTNADAEWTPPQDGDDAIIKPGWTVTLDADCPATANLRWLDIYGTLKFVGSSWAKPNLKVSAQSILIAPKSGRMEAGSVDSPFTDGTVTIELTGHRKGLARPATHLSKGALRKYMMVLGTLSLHGTPRVATWLRLAEDAQAGASTVVVDASLGSSKFTDEPPSTTSMTETFMGERVVISSSSRNWRGHEIVSVTAVEKVSSDDEMDSRYRLTLSEPLLRAHLGPGDRYSFRRGLPGTELGILGDKSTVRVVGADVYTSNKQSLTGSLDVEELGAAIHVIRARFFRGISKEARACAAQKIQGQALISHVKFENCGQRRTSSCLKISGNYNRADIKVEKPYDGAESYVHDSIFVTNFGSAIDFVGKGMTVKNNFVFNTTSDDGAITMSGQHNQLVSNNIVFVKDDAQNYFHDIGSHGIKLSFKVGKTVSSYPEAKFLRNSVSGVQYTGIASSGIHHSSVNDPEIRRRLGNNIIHAVDFQGVKMMTGAYVGYTVYSVAGYGMLTYGGSQSIFASGNRIHDVNIGVTGWITAGSAFAHVCRSNIHLKVCSSFTTSYRFA